MIMMEGGTENDLRALDRAPSPSPEKKKKGKPEKATPSKPSSSGKGSEEIMEPPSPSSVPLPSDPPPSKKRKEEKKDGVADAKGQELQRQADLYKKQQVGILYI